LSLGKIVQTLLRRSADKLEARNGQVRATVFRNSASPANLALISLGLLVGISFIHLEPAIQKLFLNVIKLLFLIALGWFLYNLVEVAELAITRVTRKTLTQLDDMIVPLIRKTLRIFLVIIFTLVVAQNVFGLNITGWLAGLGIAGLAVSLAAQDSIKNLFGSMTVFFDRPFTVGDFVTFDGSTGTIEEIGFRSTRIRIPAGHLITVPNMKFIDGTVENISKRPSIRREMNVTITYDTPLDKIEQAVELVRAVLNDPEVVAEGQFNMTDNPPHVSFNELNADSLNIRAYYWYQINKNPDRGFFTYLTHTQIVNLKLMRAFSEASIEFAFPTQTLYLAGDPARQLSVAIEQTNGG
jgi:MscS family membrane protein